MTDAKKKPHMTITTARERCLYAGIQACMIRTKRANDIRENISPQELLRIFHEAQDKNSQFLKNQYEIVEG